MRKLDEKDIEIDLEKLLQSLGSRLNDLLQEYEKQVKAVRTLRKQNLILKEKADGRTTLKPSLGVVKKGDILAYISYIDSCINYLIENKESINNE